MEIPISYNVCVPRFVYKDEKHVTVFQPKLKSSKSKQSMGWKRPKPCKSNVHDLRTSKSRNFGSFENRELVIMEPGNFGIFEPRNLGTSGPQDLKTVEPPRRKKVTEDQTKKSSKSKLRMSFNRLIEVFKSRKIVTEDQTKKSLKENLRMECNRLLGVFKSRKKVTEDQAKKSLKDKLRMGCNRLLGVYKNGGHERCLRTSESESWNLRSFEPRDLETSEHRHLGTLGRQNLGTSEPQTFGTLKHRNLKNVEPHRKNVTGGQPKKISMSKLRKCCNHLIEYFKNGENVTGGQSKKITMSQLRKSCNRLIKYFNGMMTKDGCHNCTFCSSQDKVSEPANIMGSSGTTTASGSRRTIVLSGRGLVPVSDGKEVPKVKFSFKTKVPSGRRRLRDSHVKELKGRPEGVKKSCDRTLTSNSPDLLPSTRSFSDDMDVKLTIVKDGPALNCQLSLEVPCSSPEPSSTTPTSLVADVQEAVTQDTTQERIPASCQNILQVPRNSLSFTPIFHISDREAMILEKSFENKPTVTCTSPEMPQSTPITFLTSNDCPQDSVGERLNTANQVTVSRNYLALRSSNWYYEELTWDELSALLANTPPGTFLIRNSSDPKFLFTLSVQTDRGPTSVRLHFIDGRFRLDADEKLVPTLPTFPSVIELVEYYIADTKSRDKHITKEQVWIDGCGKTHDSLFLTRPLYNKASCPRLSHLARLAINRIGDPQVGTHLPKTLRQYLAEYPSKL